MNWKLRKYRDHTIGLQKDGYKSWIISVSAEDGPLPALDSIEDGTFQEALRAAKASLDEWLDEGE